MRHDSSLITHHCDLPGGHFLYTFHYHLDHAILYHTIPSIPSSPYQYTAVHYTTLQYSTTHYTTAPHTTLHYTTVPHTTLQYHTLQHQHQQETKKEQNTRESRSPRYHNHIHFASRLTQHVVRWNKTPSYLPSTQLTYLTYLTPPHSKSPQISSHHNE